MLYKERDLFSQRDLDLEYIDRSFHESSTVSIPLMEFNSYKNKPIVRYKDLLQLQEDQNYNSIQETIDAIKHSNGIPQLTVSMEEWRPIADPSILSSISEECVFIKEDHGPVYEFCEACMNAFMETHDMTYVNIFLEAEYMISLSEFQLADGSYVSAADMKNMNAEQRAKIKTQLTDRATDPNKRSFTNISNNNERIKRANQERAKAMGVQTNANQNTQPGFWAQKWSAFKNWMNNLGNNQNGQQGQWFTNMINKVKSFFNGQAAQNASNNAAAQAANSTTNTANNAITNAINQARNKANDYLGKGIDYVADQAKKFGLDANMVDSMKNTAADLSKQKTMELAKQGNEYATTKLSTAMNMA